jgi:hypothetical protein
MTDTLFYLDNIDARRDELALHAVRIDDTWNGWAIPVVTAAEFRRFICNNANNDPQGSWLPGGVCEHPIGFLTYDDCQHDEPDTWLAIDHDEHGNALYAIDGWVWSL